MFAHLLLFVGLFNTCCVTIFVRCCSKRRFRSIMLLFLIQFCVTVLVYFAMFKQLVFYIMCSFATVKRQLCYMIATRCVIHYVTILVWSDGCCTVFDLITFVRMFHYIGYVCKLKREVCYILWVDLFQGGVVLHQLFCCLFQRVLHHMSRGFWLQARAVR